MAVPFFTPSSEAQQPTENPREAPATKRSGTTNTDTCEVVGKVVQGDFLAINTEWIVLKEGNYENWIPRDKVLSMRVSR